MAVIEDLFRGNVFTALAIGVGAVLVAPVAGQVLRPAVKELTKGVILAYQGLAELGEAMGDIVAEAQDELVMRAAQTEATTAPAPRGKRQG